MIVEEQRINIEIPKEKFQKWNLFFAIPCYDFYITEPFMMSLLQALIYYKEIGIKYSICTISDSLIARARNNLTAKFMANESFTHMVFIDPDIKFEKESVLKLLWHDKDIVAAPYPVQEIDWDKIKEGVNNNIESKDLMQYAARYVVHLAKPGQTQLNLEKGAIECYEVGTGFMVIKREVFQKMFKKYKKLKYKDDTGALSAKEAEHSYAFFNSYIDDDGRLLSEDYGFCHYWQKIGGKIWVDPSIDLTHFGRIKYQGKMLEFLRRITQ